MHLRRYDLLNNPVHHSDKTATLLVNIACRSIRRAKTAFIFFNCTADVCTFCMIQVETFSANKVLIVGLFGTKQPLYFSIEQQMCNGRCASSRVRVDDSLTSRRVELVRRNKREDIFYGQL